MVFGRRRLPGRGGPQPLVGEALDWRIIYEADGEVVVVPPHAIDPARDIPLSERGPGLVFVPVPEG